MQQTKLEMIFRQYDLRGTYDDGLDDRFADRLGFAFHQYLKKNLVKDRFVVSVGSDVRLSSPSLKVSLVAALNAAGIDVIDLGTCPTPLLYFSLFTHPIDGGIMITGSHNPPEYNGFKICLGKEAISGEQIQDLKRIFFQNVEEPVEKKSGMVERLNILKEYQEFLSQQFGYLADRTPVKIAVDAGNGTGGLVAPALLKRIGCEVIELFCQPDGNFPHHHPDPTVLENLKALQETVVKDGCDLGIAFDGDADRLGVVDENGEIVYGDKLLAVFAETLLEAKPGASILGEVKCSQVVFDWIERLGGKPIMWKTGHSLIKKKMREENALLAGEMSGHFFFADRYFGFDDAIYAACRLVEVVKKKKKDGVKRFGQLLAGLPRTVSTPEIRVDCPDEMKAQVVECVKEKLTRSKQGQLGSLLIKRLSFIDGVRIQFDEGWGLVRASNTQPALVLRFEAGSEEKREAYRKFIQDLIEECKKGTS